MPLPLLVPAIISGIGALAGAMGNRGSKTTQETNSTTNSSSSTNPNYDSAQLDVRNYLLRALMGQIEQGQDMTGYVNNGVQDINRTAGAAGNNIRQMMISRGLGKTSAGVAPEIANENARFGEISRFLNNAPLVQEEQQRKRMGDLASFFATLPVGTNQTGTQTTTGTGTQMNPGNMLGGALQNGAQMAAFLTGQGAFGKNSGGGSGYNSVQVGM